MRKTYQPKEKEVTRSWHTIDAKGQILGRVATKVVTFLVGKHKPTYSAHMDMGDYVVVTNVEEIELTGKKEKQKKYYFHSGYPGGFRETTAQEIRAKHPERLLEKAVFGMLADNRLRDKRMKRLKLFVGSTNPYEKKVN
jgi:large subunit ribosomal protein L13